MSEIVITTPIFICIYITHAGIKGDSIEHCRYIFALQPSIKTYTQPSLILRRRNSLATFIILNTFASGTRMSQYDSHLLHALKHLILL